MVEDCAMWILFFSGGIYVFMPDVKLRRSLAQLRCVISIKELWKMLPIFPYK